jgi:predicted metal-dependent HD superfamily phosphohydrolase
VFECKHAPFALPPPLATELAAAYNEPQRAYHNASHIAELLRWFDTVAEGPGWQQPNEVYAAILFHDAIYVPGAKDNESHSADWARRAISEAPLPANADRVAGLINLTAQHGRLEAVSGDDALFLDSDMAIIGTDIGAYREYAQQIRREYAAIPPELYRAGRGAFVEALARKPRIYFTDYFHDRLDARARQNLADELAQLGVGANLAQLGPRP